MRIAAGILMIIASTLSIVVPQNLTEELAFRVTDSSEAYVSFMMASSGFIVWSVVVFLILIVGGAVSAFRRKAWWWALSGGIGCVILGAMYAMLSLLRIPPLYHNVAGATGAAFIGIIGMLAGILAIIFLVKRNGEFLKLPPSEHKLVQD